VNATRVLKLNDMHEKSRGNVKALVFDLDGTLIDSQEDLALAVNLTLRAMGREALTARELPCSSRARSAVGRRPRSYKARCNFS